MSDWETVAAVPLILALMVLSIGLSAVYVVHINEQLSERRRRNRRR